MMWGERMASAATFHWTTVPGPSTRKWITSVKGSEKTNSLYTTDYPCNYEGKGYVVPHTYLVCPHCSQQKAVHLASLYTKVWMEEIE